MDRRWTVGELNAEAVDWEGPPGRALLQLGAQPWCAKEAGGPTVCPRPLAVAQLEERVTLDFSLKYYKNPKKLT